MISYNIIGNSTLLTISKTLSITGFALTVRPLFLILGQNVIVADRYGGVILTILGELYFTTVTQHMIKLMIYSSSYFNKVFIMKF
jgi:hypothetical protein